uniref:Uncharacterized protein n=1 Tax=Anguilla anguilla TaxID=7936 RepID=A0A0E9TAP1_ANGAN
MVAIAQRSFKLSAAPVFLRSPSSLSGHR